MALRDLISPKPYPISTPGAKTTAPAPVVVEDDVAPMEKSLSAGRTTLEQLRADQTRMGGEAANLTLQIAADTANLVSYRNAQEVFKAEQKVAESQGLEKNIKKMLDDERSSPQYKEKERINKELAELGSFVPTEVTAPMLGVLFSAIGATGMLLGGNSKSHAKFAMAAMNGMAEGFGKGREQYNKEQKAAFDTNVKLLQTKLSAIKDGLEDARREAILNKEAADIKVRQTLASNEAQFLQKHTDQRGLESTIALVDGQLKNLNRAIRFQTSKATQLAGQLDAKETQLAMRKIESARREAEARIRSQDQERRDRERRQDRLSDIARSENFQMQMLDLRQQLKSGQKEDDDRQKMGAVEARTLRDTRKLQGDMSSLIDDLQNPTLIKQIDDNRAYAFLTEESKVFDQLLAKKLPPELQSFLLKVRSVRNKYYLDTSGKAVTGGEALRNYGVVAQPGDTAERARQKLEIGLASVEESIKDFQATYKVPKALQERLGEGRVDFATMEEYEKSKKTLKDGQKVRVAGRNATHQAEK
jgi:hypothetical protein